MRIKQKIRSVYSGYPDLAITIKDIQHKVFSSKNSKQTSWISLGGLIVQSLSISSVYFSTSSAIPPSPASAELYCSRYRGRLPHLSIRLNTKKNV